MAAPLPPLYFCAIKNMSGKPITNSNWAAFSIVMLAGIACGLQVGKMPPLLDGLRAEFALGMVGAGLMASAYNLIGGGLGILGGMVSDRLGGRHAQALGLGLLGLGNLIGAQAGYVQAGYFGNGSWLLVAGRLVEGIGFVLTVVAGPSLIARLIRPEQSKLALGLWANYMPLGVALGLLLTPPLSAWLGWRGLWLAMAGMLLLFALALLLSPAIAAQPTRRKIQLSALAQAGPWLLAGCFAFYALQWFAIITWLPSYLNSAGLAAGNYGTILVVLANVLGGLCAALLMQRGVARWLIIACVSTIMGLCGLMIFGPGIAGSTKLGFAFLASGLGGMIPAAVLASVPLHARKPQEIATVNGVVVQVLNLGAFLGPPTLALLVTQFGGGSGQDGWSRGRWLLLLAGLIGLGLALLLRRTEKLKGSSR